MKKQQQERSPRYRFWRNVGIITVSGLIGGVIGFLTGMFGSEKPLEIQSFFSKEVLLLGSILLFLIVFLVTIALLMCARKVHQKMLQIEDEEEAYHYDIQKKKLYGLATIFKGIIDLAIHFSQHLLLSIDVYGYDLTQELGLLSLETIPYSISSLL